jgi:hypothetical protein
MTFKLNLINECNVPEEKWFRKNPREFRKMYCCICWNRACTLALKAPSKKD